MSYKPQRIPFDQVPDSALRGIIAALLDHLKLKVMLESTPDYEAYSLAPEEE